MAERLNLFILAGEPSGDRLAAALVKGLAERRDLRLSGVGGDALQAHGLRSLFPMSDLSVMGWRDVAARLPLLLLRVRQVASAIVASRPDVVVLVDSQVFSAMVARRVRKAGLRMPMVLYVAPSVWAWKPERAAELRPLFDEVMSVLPFEPAIMHQLGGPPTTYVGHPALDAFPFRQEQPAGGPLLLLPGSRKGELRRHLPLMRAVAERLSPQAPDGFVLPTLSGLAAGLVAETGTWRAPVQVVSSPYDKARAFANAQAACAVTGTVTLELMLAGVPMVCTYVADRGQEKRFRQYGVRFAALPNIAAGRQVVPERLFVTPDAEAVARDLGTLIASSELMSAQRAAFAEVRAQMQKGAPEAPLVDPAERVMSLLD